MSCDCGLGGAEIFLPSGFRIMPLLAWAQGDGSSCGSLHGILLMQSTKTLGPPVQTTVVGILAPSSRIDAVYDPGAAVSLLMWLCCSHPSDDSICHMRTSPSRACQGLASLLLVSVQTHFLLAWCDCTSPQIQPRSPW